jgi:histidinol-phosphate/aromatic aminotransferase/cobyric acid decarboxylase-like protein
VITLTPEEALVSSRIRKLKEQAGSHSPSIISLNEQIPELNIQIDACFLSNPYATDVFLVYLKNELLSNDLKLRDVLEFYPSQNEVIANVLAHGLGVNVNNIFVGNGAVEVIQAVMHNFIKNKVVINVPTFSPYYEYVKEGKQVVYYALNKEDDFTINVDHYIAFIRANQPDTIVLINPNNPDGGYIAYEQLRKILVGLKQVENIIIDESFVHFAFEDENRTLITATELFKEFENVIVIKSMSKDFGIAGIRCGYGVMNKYKVMNLLKNGYLWNSNGLSEYFFRLYERDDFKQAYEVVRKRYIADAQQFFQALRDIPHIRVYPSKANFALLELLDGTTSADFVSKLLIKYGVYTRNCSDKIGLHGEFVRIAGRTRDQNEAIIAALRDMYGA